MNLASLVISSLSLVVVLFIGLRTISIGQRSNALGERSARAAEDSANASVAAARATERSVTASERASALAAQDAHVRRIERLLETVLEIRALFNSQHALHENEVPAWIPGWHSPEQLARLALCRQLEARTVPFAEDFGSSTAVNVLATTDNWNSGQLEQAISEVKSLLAVAASTSTQLDGSDVGPSESPAPSSKAK
jgi:hypothetical protein